MKRCMERAAGYDQDNKFFTEDFEELKNAGYLNAAIPKELGGLGLTLAEVVQEQRRLAYHALPTVLAVHMHFYWTGVAADVWRSGDKSVEWMLTETVNNGAVFAAGHAEPGNDIPLLLSTTNAERVDGGYRFTGRKSFGSLTPVWTHIGLHGLDTSDPNAPKVVHVFMPRGTEGSATIDVWDTLGMRATQSQHTVLDGAFVPDSHIARVVSAGAAGIDLFVIGIFAWALLGFANIYYGIAQRMLDQTIEGLKTKTSIGMTRSMIYHPVNGGGMLGHWGGVKLYHLVCSCSAKKSELTGQHKCPHHLLREMACLRVGQQRTGRKVLMLPILREACLEFGRQLPLCYA